MTELKKKAGSAVATSINGGVLTIVVAGFEPIIFDRTRVAECHHATAEMYGWKQRLSDAAAIARDKTTGASATNVEKYNAIRKLSEHYLTGATDWNVKVAASGPRGPQWDDVVIAAICEAYGKSAEVVKAMALTKCGVATPVAYLAAIAATSRVAPIVARLRLEAVEINDEDDPFAE